VTQLSNSGASNQDSVLLLLSLPSSNQSAVTPTLFASHPPHSQCSTQTQCPSLPDAKGPACFSNLCLSGHSPSFFCKEKHKYDCYQLHITSRLIIVNSPVSFDAYSPLCPPPSPSLFTPALGFQAHYCTLLLTVSSVQDVTSLALQPLCRSSPCFLYTTQFILAMLSS
jgi:hypothetical protein